ncbi:hypothetical protein HK405_001511 [Cladochytrium tenue]|nr:hypothetical protein HK405_001511 [Cladochytrium tenue]
MSKPEVIDYLEREVGKVASSIEKLKDTVKSSGGSVNVESLKPAVDELVQRSLARYSADVIARPDYALSSAGASVVLKLTSPIWSTPSNSLFGRMMNTRVARGLGPYFALTPGTMPGTCWSFAGPSGTLGVQLVQDVIPTDFTIDHVPTDLVLDSAHGLDSAPKDVEVWAVFDVDRFAEADLDNPKARLPVVGGSPVPGLLLATHRFDPKKASVQTFPAAPEAVRALRARKVVPGVVLLRVKSNWGNEDYTCLYRFRVHAKEA